MLTLNYQGSTMTGGISNWVVDTPAPITDPITGFYTAQLTLDGSSLVSYSAAFHVSNGMTFAMPDGANGGGFVDVGPSQCPVGLCWSGPTGNLITAQLDGTGAVTGAGFAFNFAIYHDQFSTFYLGDATGAGLLDTFNYVNDAGPIGGTCDSNPRGGMICGAWATESAQGGVWTVAAPEIDPAGLMGAVLTLACAIAVLRGRRG